jgi:hypothetical protein
MTEGLASLVCRVALELRVLDRDQAHQ